MQFQKKKKKKKKSPEQKRLKMLKTWKRMETWRLVLMGLLMVMIGILFCTLINDEAI